MGTEIDIIAIKDTLIIFTEVKLRSARHITQRQLIEFISPKKQKAIYRGILHFLAEHSHVVWNTIRVDLAVVQTNQWGEFVYRYYAGVVDF